MATTVTNYSDDELLVVLKKSDGTKERRPLQPMHTTPPDQPGAKIIGIMSRNNNPIRGYEYGWSLKDDTENYVYSIPGSFRETYSEYDIHCIPSDPNDIFQHVIKAQKNEFTRLPIVRDQNWSTPAVSVPPANELGVKEVALDNWFRGSFNRYRYIRTGHRFTVRIKFLLSVPHDAFYLSMRLAIKIWNTNQTGIPVEKRLNFYAEVVNDSPSDIKVKLHTKKIHSNTLNWHLNSTTRRTTIAHELGHYWGLIDEYPIPGKKFKKIKSLYLAERMAYPERAEKRRGESCFSNSPNIMEEPHIREPIIDNVLIESIRFGHSLQTLCCRNNDPDCA